MSAKEINKRFRELPKGYFAEKFTSPFPQMSPVISWASLFGVFIFYLVNLSLCVISDGDYYDYPVMRYTGSGVMIISGLLFLARIFWGKKMILRHKVGFIHHCLMLVGELKLQLLSVLTLVAAGMMMDLFDDENLVTVIVYGVAGLLLIADIVINIVAWAKLKRKVVDGDFKTGGPCFFKNVKNRDLKGLIIRRVSEVLFPASLALICTARFCQIDVEDWLFVLIVPILLVVVLSLFVVLAYGDALLLGKAHYIKKFGMDEEDPAEEQAE